LQSDVRRTAGGRLSMTPRAGGRSTTKNITKYEWLALRVWVLSLRHSGSWGQKWFWIRRRSYRVRGPFDAREVQSN
jgi:hypothetical protein